MRRRREERPLTAGPTARLADPFDDDPEIALDDDRFLPVDVAMRLTAADRRDPLSPLFGD